MMLIHHFFGDDVYLRDGSSWEPLFYCNGIAFEKIPAAFGKLCVSFFAFQSGYALWVSRKSSSIMNTVKRGLRFLLCYWIIELFFLFCGVITNSPLPDFRHLLMNLFGIGAYVAMPFVNVSFAWYVAFYLVFLLISIPLLKLIRKSRAVYLDLAIWISAGVLLYIIPEFSYVDILSPMPVAVIGILAAKHGFFEKISALSSGVKMGYLAWGSFMIIVFLVFLRYALVRASLCNPFTESLIVMAFIPGCLFMASALDMRVAYRGLSFIGSVGMNVWFLQGLFFTALPFQSILYAPKFPLLILLWGLILLLPLAYVFKIVQTKVLQVLSLK